MSSDQLCHPTNRSTWLQRPRAPHHQQGYLKLLKLYHSQEEHVGFPMNKWWEVKQHASHLWYWYRASTKEGHVLPQMRWNFELSQCKLCPKVPTDLAVRQLVDCLCSGGEIIKHIQYTHCINALEVAPQVWHCDRWMLKLVIWLHWRQHLSLLFQHRQWKLHLWKFSNTWPNFGHTKMSVHAPSTNLKSIGRVISFVELKASTRQSIRQCGYENGTHWQIGLSMLQNSIFLRHRQI